MLVSEYIELSPTSRKASNLTEIWGPNNYHLLYLQCISLQKLYSWKVVRLKSYIAEVLACKYKFKDIEAKVLKPKNIIVSQEKHESIAVLMLRTVHTAVILRSTCLNTFVQKCRLQNLANQKSDTITVRWWSSSPARCQMPQRWYLAPVATKARPKEHTTCSSMVSENVWSRAHGTPPPLQWSRDLWWARHKRLQCCDFYPQNNETAQRMAAVPTRSDARTTVGNTFSTKSVDTPWPVVPWASQFWEPHHPVSICTAAPHVPQNTNPNHPARPWHAFLTTEAWTPQLSPVAHKCFLFCLNCMHFSGCQCKSVPWTSTKDSKHLMAKLICHSRHIPHPASVYPVQSKDLRVCGSSEQYFPIELPL